MSNVSGIVKSIRDIMRKDKGTYGDVQRLEQLGWMFFLKIFDDEKHLSPSITAIKTEGMDAEEFRKKIKNNFDILLAGGQDHLKGKIFRVGHLGYINNRDIITIISAISYVLLDFGKITTNQAGEALLVASKYLEGN